MAKPITITVDKNNVVHLALHGDFLDEQSGELVKSISEAVEVIITTHHNLQKKLKVMVDLNDFTGRYNLDSLKEMVSFSNATKKYVEKTAIFGASDKERMAADVVGSLSRRGEVFKTFATKQEAQDWLGI